MKKEDFDAYREDCPCNCSASQGCASNHIGRCAYSVCPFVFWMKKVNININIESVGIQAKLEAAIHEFIKE